jgi:hypothetical protein
MGALERYLDPLLKDLDVSGLLDPDVESIESDVCTAPVVYKYFSSQRRSFFQKPQLRFTQREALNDPFEMSRRWKAASGDGLKSLVEFHLKSTFPKVLSDKELQKEIFREHVSENGNVLSGLEQEQLEVLIASDAFTSYLEHLSKQANAHAAGLLDMIFSKFESEFDSTVATVVNKMGILSLAEDPLNQPMWAHYAESGSGFVAGFDAQHDFFFSKNTDTRRHLLKRVRYTDDRIDNFWKNPYYLFLVKSTAWAYEREWRMLKTLLDCDEQNIQNTSVPLCLCEVQPHMIKTIYFGYNYDHSQIANARSALKLIGANPTYYAVRANPNTGALEEREI